MSVRVLMCLSITRNTYLACRRMKHANVLPCQYVDEGTGLHMPDLDEARFERENVWIRQRKGLRLPFPGDLPIGTCTPPVPIDEERELRVIEKKLAVETLEMDGFDVFFACDEI